MKRIIRSILLLVCLQSFLVARGQNVVAVKSNLLADALLNVNAGLEIGLAPKWTLNLTGELNAWTLSHERKWKHWYVQPEARYWFCERFGGHFIGLHAHGGQFNIGNLENGIHFLGTNFSNLSDHRYQGWFAGVGVAYGYAWVLSRHWNIEGEIGVGYAYSRFDKFRCAGCGKREASDRSHHYVGPTQAALNLVYLF